MSYLIDTNVLSELKRKKPDENVINWVETRPISTLFLSVLTSGELRKGIESALDNERKLILLDLNHAIQYFNGGFSLRQPEMQKPSFGNVKMPISLENPSPMDTAFCKADLCIAQACIFAEASLPQ